MNEEMRKAYDEDLRKYGYVKQSTINSFSPQENQTPPIKKSRMGLVYLKKIHNDIEAYWYIRNETIDNIVWHTPPKLKKEKKKKVVKIRSKQTKSKWCKDSYIYHKIFTEHYWGVRYCMRCWSTNRLQIHHKDKNHKNNDISNLIMLCYWCHCLAHKWDSVYKLMIKNL